MKNDKLAVILPVYKNDKVEYLSKAIESILYQTYKNIYLYIGVDGPVGSDLRKSLEVLERQGNISIVWFKENRGLACVLNDLLDICFKEGYNYIARMDADDISMTDRFDKQLKYLETYPEIDVVGGAINEIDENGNSRCKTIIYPEGAAECREFFSKRNPHAHPAVLFRKSFFDKLNGKKYRPEYRQNQDTMLWYDGMMVGTHHANIPDVVLNFRMTNAMFKKRRNGWAFAKKQFKDRLMINKGLRYGWKADVYGFAMFCLLVSPVWVKKIAYRVLR
jgi:glycosyltransferase involved in cell wall biosynthesis